MSQVSDAEFQRALADAHNKNIIKEVTSRYVSVLSPEDLESCGLQALWKALSKHQKLHWSKQKFTTSLWRFTQWECQQAARQAVTYRRRHTTIEQAELVSNNNDELIVEVRDCLRSLPTDEQKVLHQYYFENMSLEEVGLANGYSRETARQMVRKSERALKLIMEESTGVIHG